MLLSNVTTITEFILLGFPGLQPRYYGLVAVLFLLAYLAIVGGNGLILFAVAMERYLQKPPYLIFCILALSDILIATATLPKIIARYWAEDKNISFSACFLQMFIVHLLQGFVSLLLMIMAVDRYIAICNPLRYQVLMKSSTVLTLCGLSWLISMIRMIIVLLQSISLPYCNSNILPHSYCENTGITRLACVYNKEVEASTVLGGMILLLGPLIFIIFSYTSIIISIMKIATLEGQYKALSTCTPQIFIIFLYYIPRCFNHLANIFSYTFRTDMHVIVAVLYSLFPPMINPFIYCFRNKEMKKTLNRWLKCKKIKTPVGHNKAKLIK